MRHSTNTQNHMRLFVGLMVTVVGLMGMTTLLFGPSRRALAQATTAIPIEASAAIWSAPVNLGSAINSSASDQGTALSPDGLSLYFTSNRTGGVSGFDI